MRKNELKRISLCKINNFYLDRISVEIMQAVFKLQTVLYSVPLVYLDPTVSEKLYSVPAAIFRITD